MKSNEEAIGTTGKRIIYEEKAPFNRTIKFLMVLILSIVAVPVISAFFGDYFGIEKELFEGQLILIPAVMILCLAVWGFFNMKFRITEESVEAVMPPFSYHVLLSEIKEINTTDIPWYTNWGLRIRGRKLSFVSMHKKAVKIEKENGFFRALVLTARDPDEFVSKVKKTLLNKTIAQGGKGDMK
ncbi:MAG: hypothetical protein OIN83_10315 [Candidatus Methanoperedens sp.]|nr:hypothetical protein [Candidatus Methanoperedens sp.]